MANSEPAEEIQNLKQRIADLESEAERHHRRERTLQAFNQAAVAMSFATKPEEIFDTVAETLKGVGFSSVIYAIDETQENVVIRSITLESKGLRAAEKLAGSRAVDFTIPIDPTDALRIPIRERRTTLSQETEGILHQIMPAHLKKLSGKLAKLLDVPTAINAPLVSGEYVIGLLSIQSDNLTEEDIPLVTAFAHQLASSWHKAQIYQQAQHEITERVQTEQALRNSESRFKSIIEDQTEFLVRWLPDGTRTFVNDAYCKYFDLPREELIGNNFFSIVAGEDVQVIHEQLKTITLDSPVSSYYEHRVHRKDGSMGWLQWIDRGIFDQDGSLIEVQSVGRDVTQQVAVENALRDSEERFRNIVEASPLGMHMYQLEADGRLIFIGSNPAADKILWVDNTQFIGKTIEEAFPQLASTEVPEKYRRAAADGEPWQTTQITYEDEWIAGAYEVYAVQTSPGKMTAIFQDITDKKRTLQEQERLVSILEATSDIVGTATLDGRLVYLNQAGRQMFGLDEDTDLWKVAQFRAQPITEYLKIEQESISAALLYGVWSGESVIINPSNQEIHVSIVLIVHHDNNGDAEFISAVIRDTSALHQAEDLIHLQSTALDAAATGIFIADHQGKIIWANRAITEITGFELDEIIRARPEIFSSGQHETAVQQDISDTLTKGIVWRGELINRKKDGSTYISEQTITPVFDATEKITHYISIQQDISERKENEQALHQRAIQLALLNDIGEQIAAVLDLARVFQHVVNLVQESFDYHHVGIFTFEADQETVVMRAKAGGFNDLFPTDHALKIGQGMVGWVVENNQTLLSNDVTSEDRYTNLYPATLPTQSELCVPISIGEQVIGVLDAQSPIKNAFDNSDVTVMQTLAGQIAIAIENARLHAATERRLKETQAIATINQALIETLDLNRLLQLMVDSISQIIPHIERVVAHLYNAENATLISAAVAGVAQERKPDLQMQSGQGIAGEVIQTGLPINVRDTQEDHRFIPIDGVTYLRSLLVVPVRSGDRLLGTISVSSKVPRAFTDDDEHLLAMIGVQAALAIDSARLFEETQRRLAESNILFYISNLIIESAVPDVEAILHQVVDRLWLDFGFYHVHVYLIDQNSGTLIANQGSGTMGAQLKEQGYRFTSEEGIVGYVASVGEAFMTNNLTDVLFFKPNPHLPHTSAEFAAPFRSRDQILGVLDVLHQPPNRFDSDDFRFLTTVADQIAVVLDKALLYNQLQEALEKEQSTRAKLVQTEKLAAMGRLIASVAHELNNPLQAIQNALYLVKLEENLSDQATQDLQVAFDEGTRMAGLIARLRDTYRPVVAADYQTESMDTLTEEVCKLLDTHLRHSTVNLEFTPTPGLPKNSVIRDQIKQVILNLCLNAIESMPEGGKLTISTTYQPDVDEVQLKISDTGLGITPEAQNKIFEPFFTTKEGGTGLGLAVSYEIAQNHGGSIEGKNNPGSGATFTLALPCKPLVLE